MTKYVDILGREIYENCMHNDLKFINEHDELIKEYEKQLKNSSLTENINSILIGYKIASNLMTTHYHFKKILNHIN